jgi:MSHA biogenesis protein MshO
VEFLRTLEGGRYRAKPGGAGPAVCGGPVSQDRLRFSAATDCFEVLGPLNNVPAAGGNQTACLQGTVDCLVIFNTGQQQANAYNGDNIAGITAASANAITFDISGGAATRFPFESPRQRFHIVDMPVSYVCDPAAGTLTRQADYPITPAQALNPGGSVSLLANRVASCSFVYTQGTSTRNALLTMEIRISDVDTQGATNSIRLVEQIQVPNIP